MENKTLSMMSIEVADSIREDVESLRAALKFLIKKMSAAVEQKLPEIEQLHPSQQISAVNLVQYLALRSEDIRSLQDKLHVFGLSSLTSCESHVLRQLQAVLERLGSTFLPGEIAGCDYYAGTDILDNRAAQLFGTKANPDIPYLMVTFDKTFADNFQLVKKLLETGMNVARINCAHDNPETWQDMISLIKAARENTGKTCKIYMDLGGPKMRMAILGEGRVAGKVSVDPGDEIILAEKNSDYDPSAIVIGCAEEGVIAQLKPGERIFFDDGVIEGLVVSVENEMAVVKIIRVSGHKTRLKARKAMNFPDTQLTLPALTDYDRSILPFVCEKADLVGYSFVRRPSDLQELQQELSKFNRRPRIIVKIETAEAVQKLPSLLMQGMKEEVFGIMIARGDLAVEIGFERLSEVQEEILWISEAGHVPVIWATQVLDTLNKSGVATRSEVTDASYAAQSECVMLNKGDYIMSGMKSLLDILRRSEGHRAKKRYTFRPMSIASGFFD